MHSRPWTRLAGEQALPGTGSALKRRLVACLVLAAALISVTGVSHAVPPNFGNYIKVYAGPEGERLSIVATQDGRQALVLFEHVRSKVDGQVLLCTVHPETGERAAYRLRIDGRSATVLQRHSHGAYLAAIPGTGTTINFYFDERASAPASSQRAIDRFLKKRAKASPAAASRQSAIRITEDDLLAPLRATNRSCKTRLNAAVDWASVSSEQLRELDIAAYCAEQLRALALVCKDELGRQAVQQKVKHVRFRFGTRQKVELEAKTAIFVIAPGSVNQLYFAAEALEGAL